MQQVRIGIVEDEFIIASDISQMLEELQYQVPRPCKSYNAAVEMLEKETPDLVILDVHIDGDKDGIDVAEHIRQHYDMPIVFLTANTDVQTVERAKKVHPDSYLGKPFNKKNLMLAIEIALSNFQGRKKQKEQQADESTGYVLKNALFVKDGQYLHKIKFDELLYLASEGPYVTFYTEGKKYLVRGSIPEYLEKINVSSFFRVHRSYAVNLDKVDVINSSFLKIKDTEIPISKNYRDELLSRINIG